MRGGNISFSCCDACLTKRQPGLSSFFSEEILNAVGLENLKKEEKDGTKDPPFVRKGKEEELFKRKETRNSAWPFSRDKLARQWTRVF